MRMECYILTKCKQRCLHRAGMPTKHGAVQSIVRLHASEMMILWYIADVNLLVGQSHSHVRGGSAACNDSRHWTYVKWMMQAPAMSVSFFSRQSLRPAWS